MPEGYHVYNATIALQKSTLSGLVQLVHPKRFTADQFQTMLNEAVTIAVQTRLKSRREEMAKNRTPVGNAVDLNERMFQSDVQFVEAVMIDKWQFQALRFVAGRAELEGTVKL